MNLINEILIFLKPHVIQNKNTNYPELSERSLEARELPHGACFYKPSRSAQDAATMIQTIWRNSKIKQAMARSPYITYLSLSHSDNDNEQFLSASMFGRHVAEHKTSSKYRINNLYIPAGTSYHRFDGFLGELFEKLMIEFDIDSAKKEGYHTFIPIIRLKNTPVLDVCQHFFQKDQFRLLEKQSFTVCLLALTGHYHHNKDNFSILTASGLVASPWEITTNIRRIDKVHFKSKQIRFNNNLPKTPDTLLASNTYAKLSSIARSTKPTNKLATCLQHMLKNLPKNIQPKAIQSIACFTDIANTFYAHNYSKYAFAVYVVIHEISLALFRDQTVFDLAQGFHAFVTASRHTLDKALAIHSAQINKITFLTCLAASGANAYFLALKLALKMKASSGRPSVRVIQPSYFEFAFITQTTSRADADIFVLSAGPIVDADGLIPGVDINQFITRYIISTKRKKPTTLVIDSTTALYKNLRLNAEAKKLICDGQLSIIIHESHQKFGMIHTDQAQYGRMVAICSNDQFDEDIITEIQKNAQKDYATHLDFRVGAYISSTCGDVLEAIKEQHFRNGSLLRRVLVETNLATNKIVKHPTMLSNLDELYFVVSSVLISDKMPEQMIETRQSFGHFSIVLGLVFDQVRLSADASDYLDCLIQATQIYVAYHCKPQDALALLMSNAKRTHDFSILEQIVFVALTNVVLDTYSIIKIPNSFSLLLILHDLLLQCQALKGRSSYHWIAVSYFELRQNIMSMYQVKHTKAFFQAACYLNDKGVSLKPHHLLSLSNRMWVVAFIISNHDQLSIHCCYIILEWATASQAQRLIENKSFYRCVEGMYLSMNELLNKGMYSADRHQHIKKCLKTYFMACFEALDIFYTENNSESKTLLIEKMNQAKKNYDTNTCAVNKKISDIYYSFFYSNKVYEDKLERSHQKILDTSLN